MNHEQRESFSSHSVFFNLPLIAFALDTKGYIHSASKEFIENWANEPSIIGKRLDNILDKDLLNQLKDPLIAAYCGHHIDCELTYKVDGQTKHFFASINPTTIKSGYGCVVTAHEDKKLFNAIYKNNKPHMIEYLKSSIEDIHIGMTVFDNERNLLLWNSSFEKLGLFPSEYLKRGTQLHDINKTISCVGTFDDNHGVDFFDGAERIFRTHHQKTISIRHHYLPKGGLCVAYQDVSDQLRTQTLLDHQVNHDHLTGLPNYYFLINSVAKELEASQSKKAHLVFIDIDHFKLVNEMYGHQVGDRILQEFTARISSLIDQNKEDILARLSHDEFLLLIRSQTNKRDVEAKVKNIMEEVNKAFKNDPHPIYITITAGICEYPTDTQNLEQAIIHADAAMVQAKSLGRNRYMFYNDTIGYHLKRRAMLSNDMKAALQEDISSFTSVFQPIYDLDNKTIKSAEILLRWGNKHHGKIQPAEFIKIAEDTGLIIDLGEVLIELMVSSFKQLHKIKPDLNLSINVSPIQLTNNNFVTTLFKAITKNNIDPKHLTIELTESELLHNTELSGNLLKTLHERGCRIAIDDFGTGYSSLSYIRRYPFSIIKIDQSFIRHIPANEDYNSLVQAVIDIAEAFKMEVVAEGIESETQLKHLEKLNCQYGQGYHFAKPMPLNQFEELLRREQTGSVEKIS